MISFLMKLIFWTGVAVWPILIIFACKAKDIKRDFKEAQAGNICYGDETRLFPGIAACSIINNLDDDRDVFLCFPMQMFSGNCSYAPAEKWKNICEQPMTYDNFHNDVIFCYERLEARYEDQP